MAAQATLVHWTGGRSRLGRSAPVAYLLCMAAAAACNLAPGRRESVASVAATPPTFNEDIAPILFEHCVPCHRPGQAAPFTLGSYSDAQPRAGAIASAVAARRMPPWLPEPGNPPFVGERRLPDEHIETIQRWLAAGTPPGEGPVPSAPVWTSRWELGQPDLVATLPAAYMLPADQGHDVYRNVVLRLDLPATVFVRALEFSPGDAPVHHAVIRVDRARVSRAHDGADGQPGFDGMAAYEVSDPEGHFLGWAPGRGPVVAPDELPWALHPNTDLVIELHLMPGPTPVAVRPSVALYFTDRRPARTPVMVVMGSKAIDIPAGARDYVIEDRYQLPVDVEVLSVYPHAHYLGREMEVRAELPDGTQRPLLHIRRWSFNWQQDYRFVSPPALPRGTTIGMRYTYDNSEDNRSNPHRPPRRVLWGPQSHDEMGNLGLQLLTRTPQDSAVLTASFARHAALIDVKGAEALVAAEPMNAAHAAMLGTSYVRIGRFSEAIAHLERALRLQPQSASTENYLGGALLALGRAPDALPHFRRAAALAPRDAHLHFNLAKVLAGAGRLQEAIQEYSRALVLDPVFAEAHHHLGVVLFSSHRLNEAITHLTRATELAPAAADAHADLGGALAQARRWDEARAHLRRALELDPSNDTARENLARLDRIPRR